MENIRAIIDAVAAGVAPRAAVHTELGSDLPHGWKDSDSSGSRIKILYNPNPGYKRHIVRLDTKDGAWSHTGPGGHNAKGQGDLHQYLHRLHSEVVRESVDEVSPPRWSGTVKAMKKHKDIDNPWALAWSMKKKGAKPHYKPETDEALDPDSASALRPRGIAKKPVGPPPRVHPEAPKKEPVDPALKKRAMDWHKYQTAHPEETPEQKKQNITNTFQAHGFRHLGSPRPGVDSFAHPDHPTHIVHYLSGPDRPEGSPDGAWYHHDNAMVAHNSGYDHEALDTHLGQFFGTGSEHHS